MVFLKCLLFCLNLLHKFGRENIFDSNLCTVKGWVWVSDLKLIKTRGILKMFEAKVEYFMKSNNFC